MTELQYQETWDSIGRLIRVAFDCTNMRTDWANIAYQATMPGNIEAYLVAVNGCRS